MAVGVLGVLVLLMLWLSGAFAHKVEPGPLVAAPDAAAPAGALRARPIFLTSAAAMLAAWAITLDPIFSGLAWALIFGLLVSTLFTLFVVPMIYYMACARRSQSAT